MSAVGHLRPPSEASAIGRITPIPVIRSAPAGLQLTTQSGHCAYGGWTADHAPKPLFTSHIRSPRRCGPSVSALAFDRRHFYLPGPCTGRAPRKNLLQWRIAGSARRSMTLAQPWLANPEPANENAKLDDGRRR